MRRSAIVLVVSSALLALAGCKSPCRELSERLCDCVDPVNRESCVRAVAEEEASIEATEEQLTACEERLKTCTINANDRKTCDILRTDEGKQACGLAR